MPEQQKRPNALKHGAFVKVAILPGEDEREFDKLHSMLVDEWAPIGPTEQEAVLSIARCIWRKQRVQKFLAAQITHCSFDPDHAAYDQVRALRGLSRVIGNYADMVVKESAAFQGILSKFVPTAAAHLLQQCPRERFQSNSDWVAAVQKEIANVLLPAAERMYPIEDEWMPMDAFGQDLFKQELGLDERIDAMLDRAVKRLIQLKAMKQMLEQTSPNREARAVEKLLTGKYRPVA